MSEAVIPVLTAPVPDPGTARREFTAPYGLSLAEIVALAFPGLGVDQHPGLRVALVSARGVAIIDHRYWNRVRPNAGVQVVIRVVPGNRVVRSVLLAVVSIASGGLAPILGGLVGITGQVGVGLISAGLTVVGGLLVNALIPADVGNQNRNSQQAAKSFSIGGWGNEVRPGYPVPMPMGLMRYSPPFAAASYTEIVADAQYVRALFTFGYGPVDISDLRLGDTPISEFDEVEVEIREGRVGDAPVTLYPRQTLEDGENRA